MREIALDIETTGLYVQSGHRVIEIACIELEKHQPTGRVFHRYVNPLVARMPPDAQEIHGIPIEFLWKHAPFSIIAASLLEFIDNAQLVIHNATFDLGFINNELSVAKLPPIRCQYVDTLAMARQKFPGASNSLDALCRRFSIDLSRRRYHGAYTDCALLAAVYFELIGGKQPLMELPVARREVIELAPNLRPIRPPRPHQSLSNDELRNFSQTMTRINDPIWYNHGNYPKSAFNDEIPF